MKVARSEEELLNDKETNMVCGAAITNEQCAGAARDGRRVRTTSPTKRPSPPEQLDEAPGWRRRRQEVHGLLLVVACMARCWRATLIEQGAIGKVIHVEGFGAASAGRGRRPQWFFERRSTAASSAISAATKSSSTCSMRARRTAQPPQPHCQLRASAVPELDDFATAPHQRCNGTTFYFRGLVHAGRPADGATGRTIIIGTKGYIEIRKHVDVGTERDGGNHVFLVNDQGEQYINATGLTGYPFFGDLILDSLELHGKRDDAGARLQGGGTGALICAEQAEMVYQAK